MMVAPLRPEGGRMSALTLLEHRVGAIQIIGGRCRLVRLQMRVVVVLLLVLLLLLLLLLL